MPNNIYLMVGRSGSGKDTVVDYLCKHYNYKRIISYTTRPPRNAEDKHIFVSDTEFDELQGVVAYTEYNGHRYCATAEQVEDADLYIIDPAGVEYFKQAYKGSKSVKVIGLECEISILKERMKKRGDAPEKVQERLYNDIDKFANIERMCDLLVNTEKSIVSVGRLIRAFIKYCENKNKEEK